MGRDWILDVVERDDAPCTRQELLEDVQALRHQIDRRLVDSGQPIAGFGIALDESDAYRVAAGIKDDRDVARGLLGGERHGSRDGKKQIHTFAHQLLRHAFDIAQTALQVAHVQEKMLSFDKARLL